MAYSIECVLTCYEARQKQLYIFFRDSKPANTQQKNNHQVRFFTLEFTRLYSPVSHHKINRIHFKITLLQRDGKAMAFPVLLKLPSRVSLPQRPRHFIQGLHKYILIQTLISSSFTLQQNTTTNQHAVIYTLPEPRSFSSITKNKM